MSSFCWCSTPLCTPINIGASSINVNGSTESNLFVEATTNGVSYCGLVRGRLKVDASVSQVHAASYSFYASRYMHLPTDKSNTQEKKVKVRCLIEEAFVAVDLSVLPSFQLSCSFSCSRF
jgi:hypothetical protein